MNDDFLHALRRDPDPEYARRLHERLGRQERPSGLPAVRWKPMLAIATVGASVIALFAFPSVRASAQAVLDLFRVRNFAAVEFDPDRLERLRTEGGDNPMLAFGAQEVLQDPGPPREVPTPEAASAVAGIAVRVPHDLPDGFTLRRVQVQGPGAARLTADVAKLRALLETLEIRDLEIPQSIDGRTLTVRKPPIVMQEYGSANRKAVLFQARNPEVELPAGIDLAQLAEIGMRVLGVDRTQAHRLAQSVDWHTTLLVPVPANASSFRSVEIHGNPGLIVTSTGGKTIRGSRQREGTVVMWSEGDRVFAVVGDLRDLAMMQMAESVR